VRDRVHVREQELALCCHIVDTRAVALLEKLNSENERLNHVKLGFQPSWVAQRAAVFKKGCLTNEFRLEKIA
jgi:hypothetical protein